MKEKLSGPHYILSVESPVNKASTIISTKGALMLLGSLNEDVIEVEGYYGTKETSIIVLNPKHPDLLKALALATGQESIIQSDGINHRMHFLSGPNAGKYLAGSGTIWSNSKPKDNYTKLNTTEGEVYFQHRFSMEIYFEVFEEMKAA